ncbi:hypothetical protein CEXT_280021 [Caerostris extrusa]|uniref:Uncharacterized protein n=1 Tax=Caerostris extrusa TaxID=172846 RepID=A0AAV4QYR1_CAEEX|nr:hypothetical protein CEXT_280021 [Caerostris extrusa]
MQNRHSKVFFQCHICRHCATLRPVAARKRPDWNTETVEMLYKFLSLPAPTHSTTLSHTVECWNLFSQTRKHASSLLQPGSLAPPPIRGSQIPPVEILPSTRSHTRIHSAIHLLVVCCFYR